MMGEIYLNPLLKVSDIYHKQVHVEVVADKKSVCLNREVFVQLLCTMQETTDYDTIANYLAKVFSQTVIEAKMFIEKLEAHQIVTSNLQDFPVSQIRVWQHYKWLNALIYHMKSQNISCIDDKNTLYADKRRFPKRKLQKDQIWKSIPKGAAVDLPRGDLGELEKLGLEKTLLKRSSALALKSGPVDLKLLGTLLYLSNKDLVHYRRKLEASEKNFYNTRFIALETYVAIHQVEGLGPGIYYLDPGSQQLCLVRSGGFRKKVADICIGQRKAGSGAATIFITACLSRYMRRYKHERGYRNLLVNVAEFAQQYIFFATALGLNTWLTPAIVEDEAAKLLGIDNKSEIPIYTVAVG